MNQCSRPTHGLKDAYPFLPAQEYSDEMVVVTLSAIHSSPMEEIFNLGVIEKEFVLENLLSYLWCDIILLVNGSPNSQLLREKYHHLAPLTL